MQLNFLDDQEENPPLNKRAASTKKQQKSEPLPDLFGGLPEASPPEKNTEKSGEKPSEKADDAIKTIGEAAQQLGVEQHVLRFWESKFTQIKPMKMNGGRRYYRPEDMDILGKIHNLLYIQGYTIEGAKKFFSAAKKAAQEARGQTKSELSDKQRNQITAIYQELLEMRDALYRASNR